MILFEESINQKLISACTAGDINAAEECLKAGADPNISKGAPLAKAINHDEELIKLLFRYDAKITSEIAVRVIKKKDLDLLDLFTVNGLDMNKKLSIKTGSTYYGYSTDNYYPIECLFHLYKGIKKFKSRTLKSLDLMIKYGAPTGVEIIHSCESGYNLDYKYEVSDILRKHSGAPYSRDYILQVVISNKNWNRLKEILDAKNIVFDTSFEEEAYDILFRSLNIFIDLIDLENLINILCMYIDFRKHDNGDMSILERLLIIHESNDSAVVIKLIKLLIKNGARYDNANANANNSKETLVNRVIDSFYIHDLDSEGENTANILRYLTSLGIKCTLSIGTPDDYRAEDVVQKLVFFLKLDAIELVHGTLDRHYISGVFEADTE